MVSFLDKTAGAPEGMSQGESEPQVIELLPLQSYLSLQSKVTAANMAYDELITELSRRRTLSWPDAVEVAS